MQTHIIENGLVVNTILATVEEAQAAYTSAVCIDGSNGGIGWIWDGQTLTPPPVQPQALVIPTSVTMRQARLALLGAGLLDTVDAAITQAGGAAKIEWEYATEVRRDAPLVTQMGQMLNIDDTQLDVLFITAGGL